MEPEETAGAATAFISPPAPGSPAAFKPETLFPAPNDLIQHAALSHLKINRARRSPPPGLAPILQGPGGETIIGYRREGSRFFLYIGFDLHPSNTNWVTHPSGSFPIFWAEVCGDLLAGKGPLSSKLFTHKTGSPFGLGPPGGKGKIIFPSGGEIEIHGTHPPTLVPEEVGIYCILQNGSEHRLGTGLLDPEESDNSGENRPLEEAWIARIQSGRFRTKRYPLWPYMIGLAFLGMLTEWRLDRDRKLGSPG
jgi:hypothetical protein